MSDATRPPVGSFCWNELATHDIDAAREFYSQLIGWETNEMNFGAMRYVTFSNPGAEQPAAGLWLMEGAQYEHAPPRWLAYITVEDVDASAQRCAELGGKVTTPPTDITGVGRICTIEDPSGAAVCLFTAIET